MSVGMTGFELMMIVNDCQLTDHGLLSRITE